MPGNARKPTSWSTGNARSKPFAAGCSRRAGLPYGRALGGITFHTLRHTAASLLAELGEPEAIRKEVMGHRNSATTQRYTHLRPVHEIPAHERLAEAVPIADLVTVARKRASNKPVGKNVGTFSGAVEET
jgi:integrase